MKTKETIILACILGFVLNASIFAFDEVGKEPIYYQFDLDGKPAPQRMVSNVADDVPLPIENEFIAKLYSFHSTNRRDCEQIENREKLLVAIARGDYQTAIKEAEIGVKKYSPLGTNFGIDAKSGTLLRKYMFFLATAHELNGDWREALSLFGAIEGDYSVDFMLTEARILYAIGNRKDAFKISCDAVLRLDPLPIDSVFGKIENERQNFPKRQRIMLPGGAGSYDPEWIQLWKLRDSCARIVCPELHFVAAHPFRKVPEGSKSFDELQRESYELFLKFIDEENERLPQYKRRAWEANIFHKLEELPYGCGIMGMGVVP